MSLSREEDLKRILAAKNAFDHVNTASLTLSVILTITIGVTYLLGFTASRRLSYRLYFFIALTDILSHILNIINYGTDMFACNIVTTLSFTFNLFSTFLTSALAFNLHMIFIADKPMYVKSCTFYVLTTAFVSIAFTVLISILTFMDPRICPFYVRFGHPLDKVALFGTFGIWVLLPTLYCFVIFIATIIRLNKNTKSQRSQSNCGSDLYQKLNLRRMVTRLILYPLVPIITILPYLISMSTMGENGYLTYIDYVAQFFCATTQGFWNFLFFLFDPALPAIWLEFNSRFGGMFNWTQKNPKTELNDDITQLELEPGASQTLSNSGCESNGVTNRAMINKKLLI